MRILVDVEVAKVEMQMFSLRGGANEHEHAPMAGQNLVGKSPLQLPVEWVWG